MDNSVTLAVAGSRKTQGIVDYCAELPTTRRALIVTFTQKNQSELKHRLAQHAGNHLGIEVAGWYTLLLRHFCKPFLPFKFPSRRILGFNFDGRPGRYASGLRRFLDSNDHVYACELARLATELIADTQGALTQRLTAIYDEILIDEIQDLAGYDWDILDALLDTSIRVSMVGDIRQSVLSTNPRGQRNRGYAYTEAIHWFRSRQEQGRLSLTERTTTWRCRQEIASFSDSIFNANWEFPPTHSENTEKTDHDGVFLVHPSHVPAYIERFSPQSLRSTASSGRRFNLDFLNFNVAKGATYQRVLIIPTAPIENFIRRGISLEPRAAASFYVAVTRASQSVGIVLEDPGNSTLQYWIP
ncbi:UvrD-helicase domain-containing protein [Alcaligenes aquatilis]|uniref:UvrD-helicase domain-containing protein n=1 Tax=Alcaligenes aquatilis TaxID=323284 RepID=UPI00320862E4